MEVFRVKESFNGENVLVFKLESLEGLIKQESRTS